MYPCSSEILTKNMSKRRKKYKNLHRWNMISVFNSSSSSALDDWSGRAFHSVLLIDIDRDNFPTDLTSVTCACSINWSQSQKLDRQRVIVLIKGK